MAYDWVQKCKEYKGTVLNWESFNHMLIFDRGFSIYPVHDCNCKYIYCLYMHINPTSRIQSTAVPNSSGRLRSLFPSRRSVRRWLCLPVYTLGKRKSLFLLRSSQVSRGKQSKKSSGRLVNSFPSKYTYWNLTTTKLK